MALTSKKVAVLVHNYFEQTEFESPLQTLKDYGVSATVISASEKIVQGMNHAEPADKFQADMLLADANSTEYDALILPGGALNADKLRVEERAKKWALDFLDSGRPLAVICHAPWVLVSADAVEGRRLTSYYTIQDDIRNAGGEWVNLAVVIDGNLITSRQPSDLDLFNNALIDMLREQGFKNTKRRRTTKKGNGDTEPLHTSM